METLLDESRSKPLFLSYFQGAQRFLGSVEERCLAETEGFEPSMRFWHILP